MAKLFIHQAKEYATGRPKYPQALYSFISSKTPVLDLVWDVGTGNGQAAGSLSRTYKNVIATDTSEKQLELAPNLPNVRYHKTPPLMTMKQLEETVSSESTVDLVTVAQALHWFDLPEFYRQAKWVLKKPNGVIAAWAYSTPSVNDSVDAVFVPFYKNVSDPFWEPERMLVEDGYMTIEFPFVPVEGEDGTGPFSFVSEVVMDLENFLTHIRSWSAYQTAKKKGIELLTEERIRMFESAWREDGVEKKIVKFTIFLKIGRVG